MGSFSSEHTDGIRARVPLELWTLEATHCKFTFNLCRSKKGIYANSPFFRSSYWTKINFLNKSCLFSWSTVLCLWLTINVLCRMTDDKCILCLMTDGQCVFSQMTDDQCILCFDYWSECVLCDLWLASMCLSLMTDGQCVLCLMTDDQCVLCLDWRSVLIVSWPMVSVLCVLCLMVTVICVMVYDQYTLKLKFDFQFAL